MRRWLARAGIVLLLAAAFHVGALWALPRLIVARVSSRMAANGEVNHAFGQSLPTAASRAVVKPSPDLLYAVCVFDLSTGSLLVEGDLPGGYWSLSAFAANSDNFFVVDDRQVQGNRARYLLAREAKPARLPAELAGVPVVVAPSAKGVLLFRILVLDPADMAAPLAAQRSARCTPVGG
jgi:uncharacterized membrane protein